MVLTDTTITHPNLPHLSPAFHLTELDKMTLATGAFGPDHPNYRRVPWPDGWGTIQFQFPSVFIPMLGHNQPPSDTDKSTLHGFKQLAQQSADQRTSEIQELKRKIELLEADRVLFERQKFACDVILSPFRRLPMDTLYHITTSCQCHSILQGYSSLCKQHIFTVLSITCHLWRKIVHGTSRLWKDLIINPSLWFTNVQRFKDIVHHFQRLSAFRCMSIKLKCDNGGAPACTDTLAACLPWLLHEWDGRDRLTTLNVQVDEPDDGGIDHLATFLGTLRKQSSSSASLKSFILEENGLHVKVACDKQIAWLLELQPNLHCLWLDSGRWPWVQDLPSRPWAQQFLRLTALYVGCPVLHPEFHALLRTCSNLEVLWISVRDSNGGDYLGATPTETHTHLKVLHMECSIVRPKRPCPQWRLLFPSLDKFALHSTAGGMERSIGGLPSLRCPLNALWTIPTATAFLLTGLNYGSLLQSLDSLRKRDDGDVPLPNLLRLVVELNSDCGGPWDGDQVAGAVINMWNSRNHAQLLFDEESFPNSTYSVSPFLSIIYSQSTEEYYRRTEQTQINLVTERELERLRDTLEKNGYGRNFKVDICRQNSRESAYTRHQREFMEQYFRL